MCEEGLWGFVPSCGLGGSFSGRACREATERPLSISRWNPGSRLVPPWHSLTYTECVELCLLGRFYDGETALMAL